MNRLDFRFVQDFSVKAGNTRNTLQLSIDLLNAGNLLNSEWGVYKNMNVSSNGKILKYEEPDEGNVTTFPMVKVDGP